MPSRSDRKQPPLRVAYDIARLSAGGTNGGIKAHHYEFLRWFAVHRARQVSLLVFCSAELVPELDFLCSSPFSEIHVLGPKGAAEYRDLRADGRMPPLHFWGERPPERLLAKLLVDVLYCGFGDSALSDPGVPQVSLLVDCLHRDQPEFLPPTERARRDAVYEDAIARSVRVQTNSDFCAASLKRHFGAPDEKLLRIYLPTLDRFNRVEMAPPPPELTSCKYFFYPANFWPHKNHEALLAAYNIYRSRAGDDAWNLVLSGAETERAAFLRETCDALGVSGSVHFLGHVDLALLKTAWELCGALVFPSLYEGFGLPLLEAMHFQKPIIAGRVASVAEICGEGIHYCDPRNPLDLARAMAEAAGRAEPSQSYADRLPLFQMEAEGDRLFEALHAAAGRAALRA